VHAVNSVGSGTSASTTLVTHSVADAPTSLTNVQSSNTENTIFISWAAPTYTGGVGVAITSYKLEYATHAADMSSAVWTQVTDSMVMNYNVAGLTAG
jgi:FlaG/FlaF family flagellin (archaellin)